MAIHLKITGTMYNMAFARLVYSWQGPQLKPLSVRFRKQG